MKNILALGLFLFLFSVTASDAYARTKWRWGQLGGSEGSGMKFQREANNISKFSAYVPVRCIASDGIQSDLLYYVNGDDVPNLLIVRRNVDAEFDDEEESQALSGTVSVLAHFRSAIRASFTVLISVTDGEGGSCTGSIDFRTVKRGLRVR